MSLDVVGGLALTRDGKALMGLRRPNKLRPDLWEYPGGKVEGHEDRVEALTREWREELGVEVRVGAEIGQVYLTLEVPFTWILFRVYLPGDMIVQAIDHADLRWVTPLEAIRRMPCTPTTYLIYPDVVKHLTSEGFL